jgi:hypothetical protein
MIQVAGEARIPGRAVAGGTADEVRGARHLARHVHVARGGAAAVVGTGGALGHFHLLGVEHVARDGAQVANAVDENRTLRVEAAHEDGITGGGVAVLAEQERDARCVAQCLRE